MLVLAAGCLSPQPSVYISPSGDDGADGSKHAPFRTLERARKEVRKLIPDMQSDVIVSIAPGEYPVESPVTFTEEDSACNGHYVVYRNEAGPGTARFIGSRRLKGWKPYRDKIWQIDLPTNTLFHTLYENGHRVHKARYPDLDVITEMPVALGAYLTTEDGTPKKSDKETVRSKDSDWLIYKTADRPPVTDITKMRIHIYPRGKCDWVREIHSVTSIDPKTRRITLDRSTSFGIGSDARYFLEDEMGFLDAPGEFFVDEKQHRLYYIPLENRHPDELNITYSTLNRMIEFKGKSREQCVKNIVLDGLTFEETDNTPPLAQWAHSGLTDGAMVWLHNSSQIEIRNCHLKNSGRNGIMMIGHNTDNLVTGCWIEHMGVNGVSLCNSFTGPDKNNPARDRCEHNRIHNTHISHVGELHTYAECVTIFNVSSNEVDHCQLDNSVRYAITVRGNTGPQYGPPVSNAKPPTIGNWFHHNRIFRCGQDGGDMGALHCANLNNPGGGCVNTFEQITVADSAAIPSVQDIPPDGIFLDWPRMAMDQVFKDIEIVRSQGSAMRSHGPDNGASMQTENVSWKPGFDETHMDYRNIGLTSEFPVEYGGRPERRTVSAKIRHLRVAGVSHNRVVLEWDAVTGNGVPEYRVARNGKELGRTSTPHWEDNQLNEHTTCNYKVAAKIGDFAYFGKEAEHSVTTPADTGAPKLKEARLLRNGHKIRVSFDEPVDRISAIDVSCYRFTPALKVREVKPLSSSSVVLITEGLKKDTAYQLSVEGVADMAAVKNTSSGEKSLAVEPDDMTVCYLPAAAETNRLEDITGNECYATLHNGAFVVADPASPTGVALQLDGKGSFVEAPASLNLGPGDFTLSVWVFQESSGVIVSKGNGFGSPEQWSFSSAHMRINNNLFSPAKGAVKNRHWTHLAFVRQGNTGIYYVDGKPSGEVHDMSVVGSLVNDCLLRIGRREYEKNPIYFKGRLCGLTIRPRALRAEQIREEASMH